MFIKISPVSRTFSVFVTGQCWTVGLTVGIKHGIQISPGYPSCLVERLKGRSQLWDRADLDTSFFTFFEKKFTPTWNQSSSRNQLVLLEFQSFTEKPVLECPFAHPSWWYYFLSYMAKTSIYLVSVIWKLTMKWYLMRMCTSWLCSFNLHNQTRVRSCVRMAVI